jgi:hypothetical protein
MTSSTPTRCKFTYRSEAAAVVLSSGKVTVHFKGEALTGSYRNGQVLLDKPHPIGVEAAAALRNQRGDSLSSVSADATPEGRVRHAVRKAIGSLEDVLLLANPVGMAIFFDEGTNTERKIPYGLGSPDGEGGSDYIVPLRYGRGCQMIGLECKAPGKSLRDNQSACRQRWERAGIWWYTVQSGEEALAAVEDARRRLRAE